MVDVLSKNAPPGFYMDPVHPNAVGHKMIAEQLYNVIRTLPAYTAACQQGTAPSSAVASANSNVTSH
jgi:phospholipase/lecithinase/hemolysin